ncbi:hypothetical protein GCM10023220_16440 [Streptomyces ziwulingensis]|uniref:Secreted protein n=1 Tax=Streptomyces ziwulingensis TaxID=1045501 RepID=A0ABP9B7J6_9ACTN
MTLVAASAALLAPTTLPGAPPPPDRRAQPQASAHAGAHSHPRVRPSAGPGPGASPVRAGGGAVGAAELLAKVRDCAPVSKGHYRSDAGTPADIPVCGTSDAVFWQADLDVDCDGQAGAHCNSRTDPAFSAATAFTGSDGRPLNAETLPYIVVPAPSDRWDHRADGVRGGSVAAVVHEDRVRYAVVGDIGPRDIIGEGSYALAEELGIRPDPRAGGVPSGVTYLVFKDSRVEPIEDRQAAREAGERLARQFVDTAPDPAPSTAS